MAKSIQCGAFESHKSSTDGLSLSMFEALRSLRDAVAPESGNLGNQAQNADGGENQNSTEAQDIDELWQSYQSGDEVVVAMVKTSVGTDADLPQTREDFIRWHAKSEMEKDTELVMKLATEILKKSHQIDKQVDHDMPGKDRTRKQQMEYMDRLIIRNQEAAKTLEAAYKKATQQRDACREFVSTNVTALLKLES